MANSRMSRNRDALSALVMPEKNSNSERRVSLTGYSNIVLDVSNNTSINEEDKNKLRVRFATMPSIDIEEPIKRKYSVSLQTLKPFRPSSKDGTLPVNKVGFFSYIFNMWLSPLIWKMFKNREEPIKESDIWTCSEEEGVRLNSDRLKRLWDDELKSKGPEKASFTKVWVQFIKTRLLVMVFMIALFGLGSFFSSAFLVNKVLSYLESPSNNIPYGVGLAVAMFGSEVIRSTSFSTLFSFGAQTGTRFRSGYMGLLYDKLLRMKNIKGKTNAEIISTFSVDSYRVYLVTLMISFLLAVPVFITIATVYCYFLIKEWCFVPIGTFVVCYVLQVMMTRFLQKLRRKTAPFTDQRVRRMGEILNSMKFIKMYAWEEAFTQLIKDVRSNEQRYLLYSGMVNGVTSSIIPITPTIASVVTIAVYTTVGNTLTASVAFAVVGTMNFLRIIVGLIPFAMRTYSEAQVSFQRVKKLLLMEDYVEPSDECFDKENTIEIKGGNFVWDLIEQGPPQINLKDFKKKKKRRNSIGSLAGSRRESINPFALTDIDIEIKRGRLIGICGEVGCGKSSLVSAILGRMHQVKGHVAVNGSVAYVAQQAWIFNDSLKENILFGNEYNPDRYREVTNACGLEPDIELLTDGDETEIGERGSNLSGGQKQRVNLARAVYSDSDIYLLDDPMSALDVRVGKQIFHSCIKGLLNNKTVILVTHQLQYLKHCDSIIVMDDGCIVEKGIHTELLTKDGQYADMYKLFESTTIKAMKPTDDGANEVVGLSYIKKKELKPSDDEAPPSKGAINNVKKTRIMKKQKGRLVLSEEVAVGDIGFKTYNAYVKAAGGWAMILIVVGMYLISAGSVVFTDWWLSEWIGSLTEPSEAVPALNASGIGTTMQTNTTNDTIRAQEMTSEGSRPQSSTWLNGISYNTYFLVYVVSIGAVLFTTLSKGFVAAKTYIRASNKLHANCLDKVMKSPMSFFDANPAGRVLNRFSKDLDESDVFIPQVTDAFFIMFCTVVISIGLTSSVIPWILIAVAVLLAVFYLMKKVSTVAIRNLKRLENISRSPLLSHVNSTSQGLATIVTYKQQDRFFDTCANLGGVASMVIYLFDVSMRWIAFRLDIMAGMINVTVALIFVFSKGVISPASAGLVFGLCGKTVSVVQFMIRLMNEAEARFTSVERLHEYGSKLTSEAQHAEKLTPAAWPERGAVEFKDVVMRYRSDMDPVLRGVSFLINPQEKVGVVGRTGAGKSSLAAALFRLVELSSGQILVDGEDISKLHLNLIRSKISTIPQDPVLFNGTVRYNIDPFGKITDDEIWEALEKVHMKEKILQYEDEGLDVMIEENGENFSVGERQLICLARAVVRKSKVLLLDEATANIDTTTDALIQETIRNCFSDCTVITIAHRLNTVLHSDRILVLDSGQVMECDTPQRLLTNPSSFFNAMISAQSVKTPSP